ncbi:efflux RND transporter permease subunit [Desulfonatronovibrio hydrogenovorans]|uniref:efflux RND transporter permease subunit n=1 Tax=Desulfonatronovibrio hydrogenovorans TaxID=53245 RepID=UPI000554EF36|nr:MMPL family transporter [Desulfonatronovibrio hydrogenovorans]
MDLSFVVRRSKFFLVLSILVFMIFGSWAPFIQTVNNVDYFRLKDHPDQKYYEDFQDVFGNDEFFVIAFEKDDIFTQENLALLKEITAGLEGLGLARDVVSLANVDSIIGDEDYFYVQPFLTDIPGTRSSLERLKQQGVTNPLYEKNLISSDGKTAAIVVFAYDHPDDPDYRRDLLGKTRAVLEPFKEDTQFFLAGWTVTNFSLSQYMQRDLARFIPVTYLLIALVTFLFFRNIRLTILAVVVISACVSSTMGLSRMLDIPINNVTTIVPPLVMALTLTAIVHIFTHMEKSVLDSSKDRFEALSRVLNQVAVPCFLTTLTTVVGFLSLSISDLEPIREFSILAASGMVFGFFFSFFLLPPLILLFDPAKLYFRLNESHRIPRILGKLNTLVQSNQYKILVISVVIVCGAVFFAGKVKVETNLVEFFKKSSPERQAIDFVEERLSGVGMLDVSIRGAELDAFKDPLNLEIVEQIEDYIQDISGVDVTTSFNHFIKDMNMSFHNEDPLYYRIPESRQLVAQYLLLYDSDDIEDFVNTDFNHTRIMVRLGEHSSARHAEIIRDLRGFLDELKTDNLSFQITGQAVQDVNIIDALVFGQIYSLSIAVVIISVLMFLVFKSIPLGFLSLVPNCFPILLNFGIMGLLGIPLNTATSLIAAVAIGIAVDDTIHFLSKYNQERKKGQSISVAVEQTIMIKGRALLSSSAILSIGFGVLVLSSFMPIVYFGVLSALIMLTAVIGDLVVLPAILMSRTRQTQ